MAFSISSLIRAFVKKHELAAGVIVTILVTGLSQWLEFKGTFSGPEAFVGDQLLKAGTWTQPSGDLAPIVTLAIDDEAYAGFFKSQSPLNPNAVVSLVNQIVETFQPAVLGVDLLTEWEQYDELKQTLDTRSPLVWVANAKGSVDSPGFGGWLFGNGDTYYLTPGFVLGGSPDRLPADAQNQGWGVPLFPRDLDRAVRRVPRAWYHAGTRERSMHTFARQVANLCRSKETSGRCTTLEDDVAEAFLARVGPEPVSLNVRDYFRCWTESNGRGGCEATDKKPLEGHKNAIVLLGGTFAEARDAYPTPGNAATPGLTLNAYAVQVELSGRAVEEPWRAVSVLADVFVGFLVVMLFWFSHHEHERQAHKWALMAWLRRGHLLRRKIEVGATLIVVSVAVSLLMFLGGYVWLSWISVLVASFAWGMVIDVWLDDPPDALRLHAVKSPQETPAPPAGE